jgi:hypothetical protein
MEENLMDIRVEHSQLLLDSDVAIHLKVSLFLQQMMDHLDVFPSYYNVMLRIDGRFLTITQHMVSFFLIRNLGRHFCENMRISNKNMKIQFQQSN